MAVAADIDALPDKPGYVHINIPPGDFSSEEVDEIADLLKRMSAQARRLLRDATHSQA